MRLKNLIKESLIKEVSVAGSTATHLGAKGDDIDIQFAGGFKPDEGDIKNLLIKQVDDNTEKRNFSDEVTPSFDQDFIDLEWDYEYDENKIEIPRGFTNTSKTEMQSIGVEIKYDKIIDKTEENKKFINDTNDWKSIYDSKKY